MIYRPVLYEFFLEYCNSHPDKICLVTDNRRYSYKNTLDKSIEFAFELKEHGAKKGDHICIYMQNSEQCIFSILASILCGLPFSVIDQGLRNDKISHILLNSESKFLITDKKNLNIDIRLLNENNIKLIFNPKSNIDISLNELEIERIIPSDIASIIYTSGSTGQPKGAVHTQLSMSFAAFSIIKYLRNRDSDIIISTLPLSFDYGLYQFLMCICFGGTLVLEKNFVFPSKLFDKIDKFRCTGLPIVPSLCSMITKSDTSKYDLSSVRYITNTAAHLDRTQIGKLREIFINAEIFSMYGLTECKRVSFLPPHLLDEKKDSVGIPIPHTDVKVLKEDGCIAEHGIGELIVRGPHIMSGYWKNDVETDRKIFTDKKTREKFLRTGDIFNIDEDGFLHFICRKDEVVKVNSKKVSLFEVEEKIKEALNITELCAVSIPDLSTDNKIIAFYSSNEIGTISSESISKLREVLEPHCIPKQFIPVEKIPKSTNGKNDKNKLKNQMKSLMETA